MKAVWLTEQGGPEVLHVKEVPNPKAGDGEVLVAVRACALNHLDIWVRMGTRPNFPRPIIPGSDIAGTIDSLGPGVEGVNVGDEVVVFPGFTHRLSRERLSGYDVLCEDFGIIGAHRNGGCAEFVAVPATNLVPKPSSLKWEVAASVPVTCVTAWHMLTARAQLQPGETVLIQSAGSGVSAAAIQIARLIGARVIATTGSEEKMDRAKELGAEAVLNYWKDDVPTRVRELTGGRGAGVVLDHMGAATFATNMASLAKGGRLVFCGTTGGAEATVNLAQVYYQAQSILGSTLGTRAELATVLDLVAQGKLAPVIDKTFPLDQIRAAHEYMENPDRFGKVVMTIR
jgi:NADPH:quinone reductase-like Zn-dependent oxidoreductase